MSARSRPSPRTVVEVLHDAAARHGDVEAYVEPEVPTPPVAAAGGGGAPGSERRTLTFGQWDRAADGVAGLLYHHGVRRGDVVAVILPSSIDYAVLYAAALRLGAITSGLNPRLGPVEKESILHRAAPVLTVTDPHSAGQLPSCAGQLLERTLVAQARTGDPPPRLPRLDPKDPVAVVWTSGTTGAPKGAVFDHVNLAAVAAGTDVLSQPGDRRLSPLPFAHVGYMTRAWDEIEHCVTTVITPTPWRAAEALSIMVAERITVAQGVPAQWRLVLDLAEFDNADLSAVRVVGTGAARVPESLVAELRQRLEAPVVVRYTSTESSLGTGTVPGDPDEVVATTVGRPVPGVELSIMDPDRQVVPEGEVGRVCLRSGAVMRGYWGDPGLRTGPEGRTLGQVIDEEASSKVLWKDGWLATGDFGFLGADGNLRLVGRDNELYIRGGYNVFPAEVEEVLAGHPDVAQAAVVGAPDPVLGEVGVAFVVPRDPRAVPSLDQLRDHCRQRLSDYKAPDAVVTVEALPLTPMMKVDRRPLFDQAAKAASDRPLRGRTQGSGSPSAMDPAGPRGSSRKDEP